MDERIKICVYIYNGILLTLERREVLTHGERENMVMKVGL
jgi:hypothetical protein